MAHNIEITASFDASDVESGLNKVNELLSNIPEAITTIINTEDNATADLNIIKSAIADLEGEYNLIISADGSDAISTIEEIRTALESLYDVNVTITATDNATEIIESITSELSNIDNNITTNITIDDQATTIIDTTANAILSLDDSTATVVISAEDQATPIIETIQSALTELDNTIVNVGVTVEDQATSELDTIKTNLSEIDNTIVTATIGVDNQASIEIDTIQSALTEIDNTTVNAVVTIDDQATGELENITSNLSSLDVMSVAPTITIDDTASSILSNIESSLQSISDTTINVNAESAIASIEETDTATNDLLTGLGELGASTFFIDAARRALDVETAYKRLGVATKQIGLSQDELRQIVSRLSEESGRTPGVVRESLIQLGLAGIKSKDTLEASFLAITSASAVSGYSVDTLTGAYRRLISQATFNSRMLNQLGVDDQTIMHATGMSIEKLREAWKSATPEQRAYWLNQIMYARYGTEGNEIYKESWAGLIDQIMIGLNGIIRTTGSTLLPFITPAMKMIGEGLQFIASILKALPAPVKTSIGVFLTLLTGFMLISGAAKTLGFLLEKLAPSFIANSRFVKLLKGEYELTSRAMDKLDKVGRSAWIRLRQGASNLIGEIRTARAEGNLLNLTMSKIRGIPSAIVDSFRRLKDAIVNSRIAQALFNTETDKGTLATVRNSIATAAATVKTWLQTAATYALAAAQALLNAIMSANPLTLLAIAIAAVIGVLIYLWNTNEGFRDSVMALWDGLRGLGGFIWGVLLKAWEALTRAIKWLADGFKFLAGGASGATSSFGGLGGMISMLAMGPIGLIIGMFKLLIDHLGGVNGVLNGLNETFNFITSTITNFANMILTNTVNGLKTMWGWLNGIIGVLSNVSSAFGNVGGAIISFATNAFGYLYNAVMNASSYISKFAANIVGWITNSLISIVSKAAEWSLNFGEVILNGLAKAIGYVINFVTNILNNLSSGFMQAISLTTGWLGNFANLILKGLNTAISHIIGFGVNMLSTFSSAFTNVINSVVNFIGDLIAQIGSIPSKILPFLQSIGSIIFNILKEAFENVYSAIIGVFGRIISFFAGIIPTITNAIINITTGISNTLSAGISGIMAVLGIIFNAFLSFISNIASIPRQLINIITNMFSNVASYISGTASSLISRALKTVSNVFSWFVGLIRDLPANIIKFVKKAFGDVIDYIASVPKMLWSALNKVIDQFRNFLKWLADLPKNIYGAGKRIMQNLINSILDGIPGLKKALEWISRLFPKSPAKEGPLRELDKIGYGFAKEVNKGFLNGVKTFRNDLISNMRDITNILSESINIGFVAPKTPLTGPVVTSSSVVRNNFNLTVNVEATGVKGDSPATAGEKIGSKVADIITANIKRELLAKGIPPTLYDKGAIKRVTL